MFDKTMRAFYTYYMKAKSIEKSATELTEITGQRLSKCEHFSQPIYAFSDDIPI